MFRKDTIAYKGERNVGFSGHFSHVLNEWHIGILTKCKKHRWKIVAKEKYFSKYLFNKIFSVRFGYQAPPMLMLYIEIDSEVVYEILIRKTLEICISH